MNCDDENVSIMDPPNFQLKDSLDASGSVSNEKADKVDSDVMEIDPSSTRDPATLNDFKSNAAYMLCYTARSPECTYPEVPTRILESVVKKNAIAEQDIAEQERK